jgi:hypothetical protein
MEVDCTSLVQRYLLLKNPLYTFNFPISILVAIIVFGYCRAYKVSDNSYINQILIPIVALLLCMVILDLISRSMISTGEVERLSKLCSSWMNDPNNKKKILTDNAINMFEVEHYTGQIENFTSMGDVQESKDYVDEVNVNSLSASGNKIIEQDKPIFDNVKTNFINNPKIVNTLLRKNPEFEKKPFNPQQSSEITCVGNDQSNQCHLCSGMEENPNQLVAPIAGPTWLPQSAESVQKRLKQGHYTANKCVGEPPFKN